MTCEAPKEAWDKLKAEFEGNERVKIVKLLTLKKEFEMLKMKAGEIMKECASKLLELVNKIRPYGKPFEESKVVEKMLISVPIRFEANILAIEESCYLKILTIGELNGKLQAHEQRTNMRGEEVLEGAFQAKRKGKQGEKSGKKPTVEHVDKDFGKKNKFPPYKISQRINHVEKNCWFKGKPQIECRFCKKLGHMEKNCRIKLHQSKEPSAVADKLFR